EMLLLAGIASFGCNLTPDLLHSEAWGFVRRSCIILARAAQRRSLRSHLRWDSFTLRAPRLLRQHLPSRRSRSPVPTFFAERRSRKLNARRCRAPCGGL